MSEIYASPLFGIVLCIFSFEIGLWINRKTRSPLANPLLIAIAICIAVLQGFAIPLESFQQGGQIISMFLAPATAALALSIYSQWEVLKKNFLPILAGTLTGSLTSIVSVLVLCKLFGLSDELTASMIPKSVTTPIAMEISNQQGGIVHQEGPIDISNVMYLHNGKPTRVGFKMDGDKKVRFAKSTGEVID